MVRFGSRFRSATQVLVVVATLAGLAAPAGGQGASLVLAVDVERFSARAAAWTSASAARQVENLERAADLGREAAQAEADAEAAAAAARAAVVRVATTTVPPATTVPPTTTAPPATTVPPTTEAPTTTAAPDPPSDGPTPEQWAALRHCESGGRYDAVSPSGAYRGAYQFARATWDWVASFNDPSLVGVDPAAAAPADQDGQAYALYDRQGASPWPHCGVHLSS